ncbi:hypothetical protein T439DRAFT_326630 [Meredithblackwellia eburnea MCA 4105]
MSRRPSYPARVDDDLVLSSARWSVLGDHRPSVGQDLGMVMSPRTPSSPSPSGAFVPLTFDSYDMNAPVEKPRENSALPETNYTGIKMDGVSIVLGAPSLKPYQEKRFLKLKLKWSRTVWERVLLGTLALTLLLTFLRGKTVRRWVTKAHMSIRPIPVPLRSTAPIHSFRANLIDGRGYVSSFPYGGLTNQLVEIFKLVHLGQRLDRAAIIPDLRGAHSEGDDVPLGKFFDVPAFSYYSNVSVVDWRNVKLMDSQETEEEQLSCWGWRNERPLERLGIQTDFYPPPGQLSVPSSVETSMTFPAIEVLVSQNQKDWLEETAVRYYGSLDNAPPYPDQQLLCFENLYYVPSTHFVEGEVDKTATLEEFSSEDPIWTQVGRHLRFLPSVNRLADELITSLLGSTRRNFIGVHIRQGDAVEVGRATSSVITVYSNAEKVVQDELVLRKRASWLSLGKVSRKKLPVLFVTDSDDQQFLKRLSKMGWIHVNHRHFATVPRFGGWYPTILDAAVLSRGVGFVGTSQSQFSTLAARRVETWNGGVTRIVA